MSECVRTPVHVGGVFQSTMGLIHALGRLDDGRERYTIVAQTRESMEWLKPHVGPNQQLVVHDCGDPRAMFGSRDGSRSGSSATRALKAALAPVMPVARYVQNVLKPTEKVDGDSRLRWMLREPGL